MLGPVIQIDGMLQGFEASIPTSRSVNRLLGQLSYWSSFNSCRVEVTPRPLSQLYLRERDLRLAKSRSSARANPAQLAATSRSQRSLVGFFLPIP
jgi:hypothetical protein